MIWTPEYENQSALSMPLSGNINVLVNNHESCKEGSFTRDGKPAGCKEHNSLVVCIPGLLIPGLVRVRETNFNYCV
jgi:hypothetical protein